jgi:cell division transport system ATP-binding protein
VTVIISTHELPNIPVKFKHLHLANGLLSSNNQRYAELPA